MAEQVGRAVPPEGQTPKVTWTEIRVGDESTDVIEGEVAELPESDFSRYVFDVLDLTADPLFTQILIYVHTLKFDARRIHRYY